MGLVLLCVRSPDEEIDQDKCLVFDESVTPRWRQGETAFTETVDKILFGHENFGVKTEH